MNPKRSLFSVYVTNTPADPKSISLFANLNVVADSEEQAGKYALIEFELRTKGALTGQTSTTARHMANIDLEVDE